MTTVAQLIAHLQTLPQGAEVRCLKEEGRAWDTYAEWKDLDIENDVSVCDLRNNQFVKPEDENFGKVFVEIGDK
jgi:hypothetical protein